MKILKIAVLFIVFCIPLTGTAQNATAIAMNSMVFDSTSTTHIPGVLVSPIIPIGKSKYDVWGLVYVQKDYLEMVAGFARNIGNFGFGLAGGPEFTPKGIEARLAGTVYYNSPNKKHSFYGYVEGYPQGTGLWYIAYHDWKIKDWLMIGPYIQYESGVGGRVTLTIPASKIPVSVSVVDVSIPKCPISVWGAVGHKGAVLGLQIFFEKEKS